MTARGPISPATSALTRRRCLAAAASLLCVPPVTAEPALRVVTEEFPPYNLTDAGGRVTGFSTEVVQAVLKELGVVAEIQSMPWARAYDLALNDANVLIYSITRTAARDALFQWVGRVAPSDWFLFALAGRDVPLSTLAEAMKYQIATVNQDAGEQYLLQHGFVLGRNLQSSNRYELNLQKLMRGRVDLWIANDLVARHLVRQGGADPDRLLERALALPDLGSEGLHMAFSRRTPAATVERFRRALELVKRNGTYETLRQRWL